LFGILTNRKKEKRNMRCLLLAALAITLTSCTHTNQGQYVNALVCPITITAVEFSCGWDDAKNDVTTAKIHYKARTGVNGIVFAVSPVSSFGEQLKPFLCRDYTIDGTAHARGYSQAQGAYGPYGVGSVTVEKVLLYGGNVWTKNEPITVIAGE
jgi:hypothetical protein